MDLEKLFIEKKSAKKPTKPSVEAKVPEKTVEKHTDSGKVIIPLTLLPEGLRWFGEGKFITLQVNGRKVADGVEIENVKVFK